MKIYRVSGKYQGKEIESVTVDNHGTDGIRMKLWIRKPGFENIPTGQDHYDFIFIERHGIKDDWRAMLYNNGQCKVAKKHIRSIGLKVVRTIV